MTEIKITRIYLREQAHLLEKVIDYLKAAQIRGYTVFQAVSGHSKTEKEASSLLIDLAMDLPLVVEFFDNPHKIDNAIHELQKIVKPEHIVSWMAEAV